MSRLRETTILKEKSLLAYAKGLLFQKVHFLRILAPRREALSPDTGLLFKKVYFLRNLAPGGRLVTGHRAFISKSAILGEKNNACGNVNQEHRASKS